MKYKLQGISTLSIARFGCLLGWIVTIVPSLICGLVSWGLLTGVRSWLEGLESLDLNVLGFETSVDLVELLQLGEFLATLQTLAGRALPLLLAMVIVVGVLGGALVALTLILLGWGYNLVAWLTGGLEVQLEEISTLPAALSENDQTVTLPRMGHDEV
jgi:phosphotransferase system  glucose/maltose/N-acetylglucosamine-specific IIC component